MSGIKDHVHDGDVQLSDQKLMPPSPYPLYPADLKIGEERVVTPPCPPWRPNAEEIKEFARNEYMPQFDRRYWKFGTDYGPVFPTETISAKWLNEPERSPTVWYGRGCGVDPLDDLSIIQMTKKPRKSGFPDLWEAYGLFIVSDGMLELLRSSDPESISYKRIHFIDLDGNIIFDNFYFLDVIRNIRAVDYANSIVHYKWERSKHSSETAPYAAGYPSVRILADLDPKFQIFRQVLEIRNGRGGTSCIVADQLKERLEAARPNLKGFRFSPMMYGI